LQHERDYLHSFAIPFAAKDTAKSRPVPIYGAMLRTALWENVDSSQSLHAGAIWQKDIRICAVAVFL
jgi:hypothetical protein